MPRKTSRKPLTSPRARSPKKTTTVPGGALPEIVGSEAAFESLLPAARALPTVVPLRADVRLAVHNATVGANALLARAADVTKLLPSTDLGAIREIPRLGSALAFAATRIDRSHDAAPFLAQLARARRLRAALLATADSLAHAGLVPEREVAKIRAGRGQYDTASDCVALAALFTKNAPALKGKHPVTKEQIEDAATVGTALLATLKPGRAKRVSPPADAKQAVEDRDRLWSLLLDRYDRLWRAAAYLFGPVDLEANVPALLAAHRGPRKPTKATPGAPSRPTAPATP